MNQPAGSQIAPQFGIAPPGGWAGVISAPPGARNCHKAVAEVLRRKLLRK